MRRWKPVVCLLLTMLLSLGSCDPIGPRLEKDVELNSVSSLPVSVPPVLEDEYPQHPELDKAFFQGLMSFCASATALAADTGESFVFSPVGLYLTLATAAAGTRGQTLEDIKHAFFMEGIDNDTVREQTVRLLESLLFKNRAGELTLNSAVWVDSRLSVKDSFMEQVKNKYKAVFRTADLGEPETQQEISDWVSEQTGGTVTRSAPDNISPDAVMFLLNAVYFENRWSNPFSPENTRYGNFNLSDDLKIEAKFINHTFSTSKYIQTADYESLEIPFENGYHMTFYLPTESHTAAELLTEKIIFRTVREIPGASYSVSLSLPKFKVGSRGNMSSLISALGMGGVMNSNTADFSGISDQKPLWIERVEQTASVSVDEKGCGAEEYGEEEESGGAAGEEEIKFLLDRPFAFTITDSNQVPLFTGVIQSPAGD